MTREERLVKMAELRASAENKCKEYNASDMKNDALEEEIKQAVNEYTSHARTIAFEDCAATDDPMLAACKQLVYPTIRVKDEPVEDSKVKVRVIEDTTKVIDLAKLNKFCKGGIGHDKNWIYAIEQLNYVLTAQKAEELGIDPKDIKDNYYMNKLSREYSLGKNPASNTNLLKTLNSIIAMMLGDSYKCTSHDVAFLKSIWSKKGKNALCVSCANHKFMRNYMQEIAHRVITGKTYTIDYKKIK